MEKGVYSSQDLHPLLFIFIFVYILVSPSWNSQAKRWLFFLQTFFFVFFFFFWESKKGDSRVAVIVPCPMVQLGKPMGTTNSNWSSKTPNPHTPQALLVSGTSRNCNYSSCENSNLGCGEAQCVIFILCHCKHNV